MEIEKKERLADGSSIVIPCVFSADATGAGADVVVVVVVVVDDEGDSAPVLDVVGSENISSSCNNKDDIFLVKLQIDKRRKKWFTCKLSSTILNWSRMNDEHYGLLN
jgi:hypothetical protein